MIEGWGNIRILVRRGRCRRCARSPMGIWLVPIWVLQHNGRFSRVVLGIIREGIAARLEIRIGLLGGSVIGGWRMSRGRSCGASMQRRGQIPIVLQVCDVCRLNVATPPLSSPRLDDLAKSWLIR